MRPRHIIEKDGFFYLIDYEEAFELDSYNLDNEKILQKIAELEPFITGDESPELVASVTSKISESYKKLTPEYFQKLGFAKEKAELIIDNLGKSLEKLEDDIKEIGVYKRENKVKLSNEIKDFITHRLKNLLTAFGIIAIFFLKFFIFRL